MAQINCGDLVPEPSTLILLSLGFVGLAYEGAYLRNFLGIGDTGTLYAGGGFDDYFRERGDRWVCAGRTRTAAFYVPRETPDRDRAGNANGPR